MQCDSHAIAQVSEGPYSVKANIPKAAPRTTQHHFSSDPGGRFDNIHFVCSAHAATSARYSACHSSICLSSNFIRRKPEDSVPVPRRFSQTSEVSRLHTIQPPSALLPGSVPSRPPACPIQTPYQVAVHQDNDACACHHHPRQSPALHFQSGEGGLSTRAEGKSEPK